MFVEKQANNDRKNESFPNTLVTYKAKDALVCLK